MEIQLEFLKFDTMKKTIAYLPPSTLGRFFTRRRDRCAGMRGREESPGARCFNSQSAVFKVPNGMENSSP